MTTPTTVTLKHDGLDQLRNELSPRVTMTVTETFTGTMVITLTIPNPVEVHHSLFAWSSMKTVVSKTLYYANAKRWDGQKLALPSLEIWREEMSSYAQRLIESAHRDPVAFFRED